MKIVNVIGGLGNQMFQYAFACYLKHHFPEEDVLLDIQHFGHYNLHNGYELNKVFPNLSIPIATKEQVRQVARYIPHYWWSRVVRKVFPHKKTEYIEPINYIYHEEVAEIVGDRYYEGYWQALPYYQDIRAQLQHEFTFPEPNAYNAEWAEKIRTSHSVGIHIRRGDYLKEPAFRGICGLNYYRQAIELILEKNEHCSFYIFSNDMQWCRENIQPLLSGYSVQYVDGNSGEDSCWDMYLMSQCENLIIANSSFSWWGAFLNQRILQVYAPRVWLNGYDAGAVYDPKWLLV